jgi:hypothetical protein
LRPGCTVPRLTFPPTSRRNRVAAHGTSTTPIVRIEHFFVGVGTAFKRARHYQGPSIQREPAASERRLRSTNMHFAYPPRKNSHPPPFRPRSSKLPLIRRTRINAILLIFVTFLVGLFFFTRSWGGSSAYQEHQPSGNPPVVIVTLLDEGVYNGGYLSTVKENRKHYAAQHGMG